MKKIILLVVTLVLLLSLVAFAADETYTIKFAYVSPELTHFQNYETNWITTFRGYVERYSNGQIVVESYPAGQLGGQRETVEGVMMGTIEMTCTADAPLSGFYKRAMITSTPGMFASIEEANAIFAGPWGQAWDEELGNALGIKVLGHFTYGFRSFSNNVRVLKTPDDIKGLKVRVMESPMYIAMVDSLGATATPMPANEMYTAMQHGVVDGQENPISSVIQDKTFEVQKYYTLDQHTCANQYMLINKDFYNSLPDDLKKIILAGANRANQSSIGFIYVQEEVGLDLLGQHMEIYTPTAEEAALWREAVATETQPWIREQIGDEIVDGLIAAIEEYRKQ